MNWDAVSGIAEGIGAGGVIISLVYVGLQVRQNTIASRAASLQQWVDTQVNVNRGLTDDPEITMLVAGANEDFDSLTSAELLRLQHVLYNHFAQCMVAFTNQRMDLLDSDKWGMVARGYELFVQSLPAAGRMWELCGFVFDEAFRNYVDSVFSRAESSEPNS